MALQGVCAVGEALGVLVSTDELREGDPLRAAFGGAEYNVASTTARLGVPSAWVSRLGADPFGRAILTDARLSGVDVSGVEIDEQRNTGLYVKELTENGTRMRYYRSGSAAAVMDVGYFAARITQPAREHGLVHLTGITPALSESLAQACASLRGTVGQDTLLSVDLNFRAPLWGQRSRAPLDRLLTQAQLLFVGRDEAEDYFGHADPEKLFEQFPRLTCLVVKDEAVQASVYRRSAAPVHVPGLRVDVCEAVGAGDAFAAGFLAAYVERGDPAACLRLGHALAAMTLLGSGDRPSSVPDAAARTRIRNCSAAEWSTWRVSPEHLPWELDR